jgi:hypothetical protein
MKRTAVVFTILALMLGCTNISQRILDVPAGNQTVDSLEEAGSVHVAVLAITPWSDIKAKLRPNLQVDSKSLREQAIPVTWSLLDKYLDILRLQAALAPTTVKATSKTTTHAETGEAETTTSDTTTDVAPGTARTTALPQALTAASAPGTNPSGTVAINSSLAARAMASFTQDVQALNAEVDSAARRTGFDPYLVRIQISVMPRRRHLGYDVYSNLSFFSYAGKFDADSGAAGVRTPNAGTPFIVPLLSSDSVETAQRAQSIEVLRDVGVALDLVRGFGSAGVSAGSQRDRQQALQGLDVNSVLTLGRLADNTLRVRLGAAFDPGGGYAVHPRTNTISVLVFFPKKAQQTRVVARSSWVHSVNGAVLEHDEQRYEERLRPIAKQWKDLGLTVDLLKEIDEMPIEGNYTRFQTKMDEIVKNYCKQQPPPQDRNQCSTPTNAADSLIQDKAVERERKYAYVWAHLLSVLPGSRFSTTIVDLPTPPAPFCPLGAQLVAYSEDDKGFAVSLRGGKGLAGAELAAVVHMAYAPKKGSRGGPSTYAGALIGSNISVSDEGTAVQLEFPAAGLTPLPWTGESGLVPLFVEVSGCASSTPPKMPPGWADNLMFTGSQLYRLGAKIIKPREADKPTETATLAASASQLVIGANGVGTTALTVKLATTKLYALTLTGGTISQAGPAASVTRRADGAFALTGSGVIEITLSNLVDNQTVQLELRPIDDKDQLGPPSKTLALTARLSKI